MRKPTPPGETLKDILIERKISQAQLSRKMHRPLKTINEIIKGKARITAETAMQLQTVLGLDAEFWVIRQAIYELNSLKYKMEIVK